MRLALALGTAALLFASAAQAADRKIEDFVGRWIGSGQATQGPVDPKVTQSRDAEVIVELVADGFKISWTTMSSSVDDGSKSKVKTSQLTFKKGKKPGVYTDVKSGDATAGKKTTWARLAGDALIITQLVIADDGQWDVTVYERTLKDANHMNLAFKRITNGTIARQAALSMVRAKD
jgi:hypothetical protein